MLATIRFEHPAPDEFIWWCGENYAGFKCDGPVSRRVAERAGCALFRGNWSQETQRFFAALREMPATAYYIRGVGTAVIRRRQALDRLEGRYRRAAARALEDGLVDD